MKILKFGGTSVGSVESIRSLLQIIEKEELGRLFPEIRQRMSDCKFHNCRHINEPGCVVMKALENDEIEPSRYESYLSIYHNNDTRA